MMQAKFNEELHQTIRSSTQVQYLINAIASFVPNYEINNPFKEELFEKLTKEQQNYFPLIVELTRNITLLYRHNRIELKKNYFEVEQEDITAVLGILKGLLNPLSELTAQSFYSYQQLKSANVTIFSRKQASNIIGYKKTQTHRILTELDNHKLVEKAKYANSFYYKIIDLDKKTNNEKTKQE